MCTIQGFKSKANGPSTSAYRDPSGLLAKEDTWKHFGFAQICLSSTMLSTSQPSQCQVHGLRLCKDFVLKRQESTITGVPHHTRIPGYLRCVESVVESHHPLDSEVEKGDSSGLHNPRRQRGRPLAVGVGVDRVAVHAEEDGMQQEDEPSSKDVVRHLWAPACDTR